MRKREADLKEWQACDEEQHSDADSEMEGESAGSTTTGATVAHWDGLRYRASSPLMRVDSRPAVSSAWTSSSSTTLAIVPLPLSDLLQPDTQLQHHLRNGGQHSSAQEYSLQPLSTPFVRESLGDVKADPSLNRHGSS